MTKYKYTKDKEEEPIILKKQIIANSLYSNELENALKESAIIENEYKESKRKGYNNANEMMSSILND